ncbi:unnamed protein product [Rotaria sp. Silwood1]|nr:unnamed protein product [Rotaria sp. Silwood1]
MIVYVLLVIFANYKQIISQSWNTSDGLLPWESYIQLGDVQQPLGLTIDRSSLAHHHFAIGYFCFHSFMYDEAQDAFDLAINITPTFVEAYIGKMLACKHALWSYTDFDCGLAVYNATMSMLETSNIILSSFQSSLLSTVYQWYANQSSITLGEQAFLSSIANLSETYPNETDIRVLWGLSLLNVAFGQEFQGQIEPAPMIEAREVLKTALTVEPNHPGALHYLIHAYDVAQSNISAKAIDYILTYQPLVNTLSYPQHLLTHIWMRTGSLLLAKSSDERSIQVSLTLCLIKIMNRIVSNISSTQLEFVLAQINTTDEISSFLLCDAENRAYATEWLSYSRLQTGDWLGALFLINDLYIAYNQSLPTSTHYLLFAYRALARAAVNLFYWLPYDIQFVNKIQELMEVGKILPFITLDDNSTDVDLAWSEAGYRFSDCIRLLNTNNTDFNQTIIESIIDQHIARFSILSSRTASLNPYISTSISMMISQIQGIIYYKNDSYQDCLNILNEVTQRELNLVIDNNSPILIYARSSELLAMHLLLIHRKYQNQSGSATPFTFMLNGTQISISEFPQYALNLYQIADISAPNRSINILGMARANAQLGSDNEAVKFYRKLLDQINPSNNTDPVFSQEATYFIAQKENIGNSANNLLSAFSFQLNQRFDALIIQCRKDDCRFCIGLLQAYLDKIEELSISEQDTPGQVYAFLSLYPSFASFKRLRTLHFHYHGEDLQYILQCTPNLAYLDVQLIDRRYFYFDETEKRPKKGIVLMSVLRTLLLSFERDSSITIDILRQYFNSIPVLNRLEIEAHNKRLDGNAWKILLETSLPLLTHFTLRTTIFRVEEVDLHNVLASFQSSY